MIGLYNIQINICQATAKILVPTPCPECGKILGSEGGMRKHRYQAHTKKAALKLAQKKKKAALKMVKYNYYAVIYTVLHVITYL